MITKFIIWYLRFKARHYLSVSLRFNPYSPECDYYQLCSIHYKYAAEKIQQAVDYERGKKFEKREKEGR